MQKPDENSVMTYCSFIQRAAADAQRRKNLNPQQYSIRCNENAMVGIPFQAEIKISKDANIVATYDAFDVQLISDVDRSLVVPGKVQPQRANQQNSFTVDVLAFRTGANLLQIRLNGRDIQDSPFKLTAAPAKSCERGRRRENGRFLCDS